MSVTTRSSAAQNGLSPNQLAKQQQIVEAARKVLARDGLAGCTVRAVADASPLTKSAIHYYFSDMDDLVDRAMAGHIQAFVEQIKNSVQQREKPEDRFWGAVETYLGTFREAPSVALLWFDYWADAVRKQRLDAVEQMNGEVVEIFTELLASVPVEDAPRRARALFAYLLGVIVQQSVRPYPYDEIKAEIAAMCPVGAAPRRAAH